VIKKPKLFTIKDYNNWFNILGRENNKLKTEIRELKSEIKELREYIVKFFEE